MHDLESYIKVFDDIVPLDLCDEIVSEYENDKYWSNTVIGYGGVDRDIRRCDSIMLSDPNAIHHNMEKRQKIDSDLFQCASMAREKYQSIFPLAVTVEDSGYTLLRYLEGDFYTQHTDSYKLQSRAISCSFLLNDGFEGGDFCFFDRKKRYTQKKGSALMFPSNFMYPHEILPVTRFTRYSIITWFV